MLVVIFFNLFVLEALAFCTVFLNEDSLPLFKIFVDIAENDMLLIRVANKNAFFMGKKSTIVLAS